MEEQRISKLIAEVLFGLCFIGAFVCIIVGAVLTTGFTNYYLIKYVWLGPILIAVGVGLALLGTGIKGAQSIMLTKKAQKEFNKQNNN